MNDHLVIMFAKPPIPGRVKTRLQPPLTPEQAADLHACFLLDQAHSLLAPHKNPWTGWLSAAGDAQHPTFAQIAALGVHIAPQRGDGLGDRMACALDDGLRAGFSRVTLIGSDSPTLPPQLLADAANDLLHHHVSLNPSFDGGFVAITASTPLPELRGPIPWSVPQTLAATTLALRQHNRLVALGAFWYDVDQGDDLLFLSRHLQTLGDPRSAPHTAAWINQQQQGALFGNL